MSAVRRSLMNAKAIEEGLKAVFLPYGSAIDTGYLPNNNTKVVCDFGIFKHDADAIIFGSDKFSIHVTSNVLCVWVNGVKKQEISFADMYCLTHHIEIDNTLVTFDGVSYSYEGEGAFLSATNLLINDATNKSELVIHQLIISENSTEIMHLIPSVDAYDSFCLIDTISKVLYYASNYTLEEGIPYLFATDSPSYFYTGVTPSATIAAEYLFFLAKKKEYGPHILSGNNTYFPMRRGNNFFSRRGGKDVSKSDSSSPIFIKYHIEAFRNSDNVYLNNELLFTATAGSSWGTQLCLGSYGQTAANTTYSLYGGIAFGKIWNNGVLIRDYVPKIENGVAGMYDRVNNAFKTSASANAFSLIYYH